MHSGLNPAVRRIEAFASLSRKAAGSQGSALSRTPQSPELLLETRCPPRVSTQTYKKGKTVPSDGLSHERPMAAGYFARCGERLFFLFWLIPVKRPESKGVFRILRDATQGSALRTRGLLKKAGENFISPAGGMVPHFVPGAGPYGIRKYPCGVFSRKAVTDLLGQVINGTHIHFVPGAGRSHFSRRISGCCSSHASSASTMIVLKSS